MIVTGLAPDISGGTEYASLETSKHLARIGVETHILTPFWNNIKSEREKENNLFVHYTNNIESNKRFGYTLGMIRFAKICKKIIREIKPDIIHAWTLFPPGVIAYKISKSKKIPAILDCRNFMDVERSPYEESHLESRVLIRALRIREERMRKKAFKGLYITTQTKILAEKVRKLYEKYPYVVPNGFDPSQFEGNERETLRKKYSFEKLTITNVASLTWRKGQKFLIEAIPEIVKKYDSEFIFVGNGPKEEYLKKRAEELGVSDSIRFMGALSRDEVAEILLASDIFVFPSVVEGFPNALIEAMGAGLPVVSTDFGGVKEIIEDGKNGVICKKERLSEGILSLLKRKDEWKEISLANKKRVKKFSWEKTAEKYLEFYREILGE